MFTGIITKLGTISNMATRDGCLELTIAVDALYDGMKVGDSICVDGVCLTATKIRESAFLAQAMPETLRVTMMNDYEIGSKVNLEAALTPRQPMSGHYVAGHVDGVAEVIGKEQQQGTMEMTFRPRDAGLMRFMPYKGSITLNGVSLTIAASSSSSFTVALIPHTLDVSNLGMLELGTRVNIEIDIIARYIEKIVSERLRDYE